MSLATAGSGLDWTVHLRRAGPLRIGMKVEQVRRVLKDPEAYLEGDAAAGQLPQCAYLESTALPHGFGLMFERGRLVRIDINEPGIRTASGIGVGDSEAAVKAAYPSRITTEQHHYDPQGHYLTYEPSDWPDRPYRIVFETDGHKVTSFRIGLRDAVALVEGCG